MTHFTSCLLESLYHWMIFSSTLGYQVWRGGTCRSGEEIFVAELLNKVLCNTKGSWICSGSSAVPWDAVGCPLRLPLHMKQVHLEKGILCCVHMPQFTEEYEQSAWEKWSRNLCALVTLCNHNRIVTALCCKHAAAGSSYDTNCCGLGTAHRSERVGRDVWSPALLSQSLRWRFCQPTCPTAWLGTQVTQINLTCTHLQQNYRKISQIYLR